MTHWSALAIGGSKGGRQLRAPTPPGVQILSISCNFWENNGQIIASLRVGAPSSGKSWIRHCYHHLMFKGPMRLNYSALVFTHFYEMVMFQFA